MRFIQPVKLVSVLFFAVFSMVFVGCQQDQFSSVAGPDFPANTESPKDGVTIATNKGAFNVLQVKQELLSAQRLNKTGDDTTFVQTKYIRKEYGGLIVLGDWDYGYSSIHFGPYELPKSDTIYFEWSTSSTLDGLLNGLEFGPHGTQFNGPVRVTLSYKSADLTGVDENKLKIAYYNENTGEWEIQTTYVSTWSKTVTVYLRHFSRYALVHG